MLYDVELSATTPVSFVESLDGDDGISPIDHVILDQLPTIQWKAVDAQPSGVSDPTGTSVEDLFISPLIPEADAKTGFLIYRPAVYLTVRAGSRDAAKTQAISLMSAISRRCKP